MPDPINPRHSTPAVRRQTKLNQLKGANPDDAKATDVNLIVAQYRRSGTMPAVTPMKPLYGDFSGPQDLQYAQENLQLVQDRFAELPADIRTASNNDPVQFLAMFEDPDQREALIEAGLIISNTPNPPITPPEPTPPIPPTTPPTTTPTPTITNNPNSTPDGTSIPS